MELARKEEGSFGEEQERKERRQTGGASRKG